ncbi:MAG TPA: CHAT domain-containing protein [Verrucomicrobiae bacterium]|nr:CHAT domain-containing protein [Verrucomicrobiae bacterium]
MCVCLILEEHLIETPIDTMDFKALLTEFVDKPEFEGIALDYYKHSGRELHEMLGELLEEYVEQFKEPYVLAEMVLRIAKKNAITTVGLELRVRETHERLKRQGRANDNRFSEVIVGTNVECGRGDQRQPFAHKSGAETTMGLVKPKVKVLFLAASPEASARLRLDREIREIDSVLQKSGKGETFELKPHLAVEVEELQGYVLRHSPRIVHFGGHGTASAEIVLEDKAGKRNPVSVQALGDLFRVVSGEVRCVVLNACYSLAQAKAISEHIDCVVGIDGSIDDEAAIAFTSGFYRGLAYGRKLREAFDLGCDQIALQNLKEEQKPKLVVKPGIDPNHVTLF